jgi:hypothetical protein
MSAKISFSTWNIHGLSHNVLGDKTKNKDFLNCIKNIDFLFLTETWSDKNIDIPGFKAFVSDVATSHTTRASRKSGGIALLTKIKFEKNVLPVKQSKNFLWCKVSKELLNIEKDLYLCGVYIPPEKSAYFEKEIFDILENDIALFSSKGYTMILGGFNARTNKLEDYILQKMETILYKILVKIVYKQKLDKTLTIKLTTMVNSSLTYVKAQT